MSGFLDTMARCKNYTTFGYVECGSCTGKKQKAIKSCLVCLDSYCPSHFELHEELHSGQRHKIMNATGFLQDKICSRHDNLLEVFCCLDQQCICLMCMMDDHKGHRIVSASAERTEKQVCNENEVFCKLMYWTNSTKFENIHYMSYKILFNDI